MGVEEEEEEEASSFPIHREAQLPGGLTYLYLASGEATHSRLSTSNEETGEFRLTFDKRERVSCVHCLARGHIPSSHLASLRGEANNTNITTKIYHRHSSSAAGTFGQQSFRPVQLLPTAATARSLPRLLLQAAEGGRCYSGLVIYEGFRCEKQFLVAATVDPSLRTSSSRLPGRSPGWNG